MTAFARFLAHSATASAVFITLGASPAGAQVPTQAPAPPPTAAQSAFLGATFAQVVQGRDVWITTSNGSRLKTRVIGIVPTGLNVSQKGGQSQTIRFEEINTVQKATHRVRTHTLIGLGIGGGFGLLGLAFCEGDSACFSYAFFTYTALGAGIGALNGAIKNSLNRDDDLLYQAGVRTTTTTVTLAPIVTRTRKGMAFSVTWR